jgi:hypothetical protein
MTGRGESSNLSSTVPAKASLGTLFALRMFFREGNEKLAKSRVYRLWRRDREAEGGGLLNLFARFSHTPKFPSSFKLLNPAPARFSAPAVVKFVVTVFRNCPQTPSGRP